ncbi:MAG: M23 family metallopeptidase [Thiotrichaceae bacterium]|nr:M23 family metallopeptidase [Thiotrichaceae bacterium]
MINIILIRKKSGKSIHLNLSRTLVISLSTLFLCLPVLGYYYVSENHHKVFFNVSSGDENMQSSENEIQLHNEVNKVMQLTYKNELTEQQKELNELTQYNQDMVRSLILDIAKLQAHITRLDFLGNRLTDVAQLDKKAFNFSTEVAIGGSMEPGENSSRNIYADFDERIAQITLDIDNQAKQFDILETLLLNDYRKKILTPAGKPAEKGYISSYFGVRKDPFTGRGKMHKGVDVAGKSGSKVLVTANGVISHIEKQKGYGQVVDVDHGYGISTRYAHNKSILVQLGDIVKQGQPIATMGSTGRSTGPHVHYEVLKNGKPVNPQKYIITARKN